jgi:hypothetical protein
MLTFRPPVQMSSILAGLPLTERPTCITSLELPTLRRKSIIYLKEVTPWTLLQSSLQIASMPAIPPAVVKTSARCSKVLNALVTLPDPSQPQAEKDPGWDFYGHSPKLIFAAMLSFNFTAVATS